MCVFIDLAESSTLHFSMGQTDPVWQWFTQVHTSNSGENMFQT